MRKITEKQREVLAMIQAFVSKHGFPPSRVEIANAMGFRSPNAAEEHLRGLERKGFITIKPGTIRGISIAGRDTQLDCEEMASALRVISTWASADVLDPDHVLDLCNKALRMGSA